MKNYFVRCLHSFSCLLKQDICCVFILLLCAAVPAHAQFSWESARKAWDKAKDVGGRSLDSHRFTVPVTGRKFLNVIPDEMLLSMSSKQYNLYLRNTRLSTNQKQKAQLNRVANKLIAAVKRLYALEGRSSELRNFHWEFNLAKVNEANAWCMYGGKILVYDGILEYANDDASLAIVLGHEMAHALAKHSAEQMTDGLISVGGMAIVYTIISNSDMSDFKKRVALILSNAGITLADLKFSRINETEADRLGLILAAMAGYDPSTAISFWERMNERSYIKSDHDWFSTHPSNKNRIQNIESFLPEARSYRG